ncbi:hypothetical protein [Teredinibacter purpureus]|uniref:hypothetical protein n=1 Tax=Teredinibacter purpureus TaxID=2731756 RepID=UPI0005F7883F|nr:hypothetical protein [Teredinibacter purpureus]
MEAKFYIECGEPKVQINGEWNALSLFLESDSSFPDAIKHIELRKQKQWMGNTSVLRIVSGSLYEVSTELDISLKPVQLYQKQLLKLVSAWFAFEKDNVPKVISV